ncbi:MAG: helix-turn-helix transcriptional regulator [Pseudomonadota bacterium]
MAERRKTPSELRNMFGANLRLLSSKYQSVSDLSRRLGINRTQYNRYLSGESFPRPDVLARICEFFDVDARVLLEPVGNMRDVHDPITGPVLKSFIGSSTADLTEAEFPSGFYRFSRRSFLDGDQFVIGVVYVFRGGRSTYVRGFEARAAMQAQGLPVTPDAREFRGFFLRQEDGVAALITRKGGTTSSLNYLTRVPSFENNFWVGYVGRTVREMPGSDRVVRMVYEHLGPRSRKVIDAAKGAGYCGAEDLLPYHRRLLQIDQPFS